ncbi:NPCBM/NEW2 domain-containing protein [Bythopirellula polymerisocia]|uniref:NPCBM/NEW2 domain protein n=1 Tax=Bythopirellula polymerisocia TaxID=2528003 RepID=A0A5C6CRR1_9BACT|nr:NPCBM/NEW2 domain-containing protein [Bythopirellula polymerisocia]TWU27240.1 NPCBM/NEW2 domain protein [Bythopirellula polymerisocia]
MFRVVIYCCLLGLIKLQGMNVARSEEPPTAIATTVDGSDSVGKLNEWTTEAVSLRQPSQVVKFPVNELLRVEFEDSRKAPTAAGMTLELVDGSRIPVSRFEVTERMATVETLLATSPLSIPTEQIRFVEFPNENISKESWLPTWQSKDFTGDVLVIVKKDSAEMNFLSGVINNITSTEINFGWEGDTIPVKRSKVAAITYYHAIRKQQAVPICWLNLAQGYRLPAVEIVREAGELRITTPMGIALQIPLGAIQTADYSVGKLTYLSDLKPIREDWTPLIELPTLDSHVKRLGVPRRDTSFEGSPLTLSWPRVGDGDSSVLQAYRKGLAMRSRTESEYRLPRGMRRFVAIAGIDPETLAQGNVTLVVEADGETLFESTIAGNQPPVPIDVEIAGKRLMKVYVDYGSNLDLGDRLHLVEARFVK